MAYSASTPNFDLPQWAGSDKGTWTDLVYAMSKIDTVMQDNKTSAGGADTTATSALTRANAAYELADTANTTANTANTTATSANNTANQNKENITAINNYLTYSLYQGTLSSNMLSGGVFVTGNDKMGRVTCYISSKPWDQVQKVPVTGSDNNVSIDLGSFAGNLFGLTPSSQGSINDQFYVGHCEFRWFTDTLPNFGRAMIRIWYDGVSSHFVMIFGPSSALTTQSIYMETNIAYFNTGSVFPVQNMFDNIPTSVAEYKTFMK